MELTYTLSILNRQPPEILYHYTTQTGLLGMVTSREIWASHMQYLNDVREFLHAIAVTKEELSKMALEPNLKDEVGLLQKMYEAYSPRLLVETLAASFLTGGRLWGTANANPLRVRRRGTARLLR